MQNNSKEYDLIKEAGLDIVAVTRMKYWLSKYMYPDYINGKNFDVQFLQVEPDNNNPDNDLGLICFKFTNGENRFPKFPMSLYYDFKLACDLDCRMQTNESTIIGEKWIEKILKEPEDSYKEMSHGTFLEPEMVDSARLKGKYGHSATYKDGKWAVVDVDGIPITDYKYWYIEQCGEGYFRAQVTGNKYNLLRPDGTEIFSVPYNHISNVHNGLAICSTTIPKTKTSPTIYMHGLLHVSGDIIFPLIFPIMNWIFDSVKDKYDIEQKEVLYIHAEKGRNIYKIGLDGTISDRMMLNLPSQKNGTDRFNISNTYCKDLCTGCVYSKLIQYNGKRCGRLECEDFRYNIIKGYCPYKKISHLDLSEFEIRKIKKQKKEELAQAKQSKDFAHKIAKEFIGEVFDGDISKIAHFDFRKLDYIDKYQKYINSKNTEYLGQIDIESIFAIVLWGDAWPNCTYEQIEKNFYKTDEILSFFQMFLAGIDIGYGCEYVKAEDHFSLNDKLKKRIYNIWPRFNSLANKTLLPNNITRASVENCIQRGKRMWREYPDGFLTTWKEAILHTDLQPYTIQDCIRKNKNAYIKIKTEKDFNNTMKALMLDNFIAEDGSIPQIFFHIFAGDKFLKYDEYIKCAEHYIDLCNKFFDKREQLIIDKLKQIIE